MEDNSRLRHEPLSHLFKSNKLRRWPWAVGVMSLIFCHAIFFLPLRALIPVSPGVDPWWGMALVVADEITIVMLNCYRFRKLIRIVTEKGDK